MTLGYPRSDSFTIERSKVSVVVKVVVQQFGVGSNSMSAFLFAQLFS